MAPAFHSTKNAAAFVAFLILLLVLPAALVRIGLPNRIEVYKAIYPTFGANTTIEQTLIDGPRRSDIVILGSSTAISGIPPGAIEAYCSKSLGRSVSVRHLILQKSGPDKLFLLLSDYLKNHDTSLIVAALPWKTYSSLGPSSDLNTVLRFGDYPGAFEDVSRLDQLKIYSEMVIAAPRQLLNIIRPNKPFSGHYDDVNRSQNRGMDGPLIKDEYEPSPDLAKSCVLDVCSQKIRLASSYSTQTYSAKFFQKIAGLAKERKIPLLLVSFPEFADCGNADIVVNLPLETTFDRNQKLIAVSARELFGSLPKSRVRNFFRDDLHLNANGARVFDRIAIPAILHEWLQAKVVNRL